MLRGPICDAHAKTREPISRVNAITSLFNPSSVVYALGPLIGETFFDGGRRRGLKEESIAIFDRDSANYKQTVLTAFQQVEDNLVALRILQQEAAQQRSATASAQESERIFNNRYVGGIDTYLQVITAQTTALTTSATTSSSFAAAWTRLLVKCSAATGTAQHRLTSNSLIHIADRVLLSQANELAPHPSQLPRAHRRHTHHALSSRAKSHRAHQRR